MGRTHGVRRGTRYMFAREYKKNGPLPISTYLKTFKVGDIVDIKVRKACHGWAIPVEFSERRRQSPGFKGAKAQ